MSHAERPIGEFLSAIASENVSPAGGSAAAIVGATGASLCEMVCLHTALHEADPELAALRDEFAESRTRLFELADADERALDDVLSGSDVAFERIDNGRLTGVPLSIAVVCSTVLDGATTVVSEGTRNAVPDAVTGATLTHAALRASLFTVRCNLRRIDDESFVDGVGRRANEIERSAAERYAEITADADRYRTGA